MDYEQELAKRDEIIRQLQAENERLQTELQRFRELLDGKAQSKAAKKPTFSEDYSLGANEATLAGKGKRRRRRKSTGRRPRSDKVDQVEHEEDVYGPRADRDACVLHAQQCAWRFIDGRAVYVRYNLYDLPEAQTAPTPPGLRNRRSEYGLEIIITLAFLHYWVGVSIDNARLVMSFFTGLELSKSQANSLLSQLANDWQEDYDAIAEVLALQMIVYVDETGWKVGKRSCYTWAFSCATYVLFRCGVGRGKDQAQAVLGEQFAGIGVSDDYAAYRNLFNEHQLCWAHFLRKAIKLMLQHPDDPVYAEFLDELYEIYRRAVGHQKDQRLSVGRAAKVAELQAAVKSLCHFADDAVEAEMPEDVATYVRLHHELADNLERLFVFVQHPEVEPTNNASERNVRREAEVRKGGRTSKTDAGAQRRGVIMTVFASLRTRFERFTLETVLAEIGRWLDEGRSIFRRELDAARQTSDPAAAAPG